MNERETKPIFISKVLSKNKSIPLLAIRFSYLIYQLIEREKHIFCRIHYSTHRSSVELINCMRAICMCFVCFDRFGLIEREGGEQMKEKTKIIKCTLQFPA